MKNKTETKMIGEIVWLTDRVARNLDESSYTPISSLMMFDGRAPRNIIVMGYLYKLCDGHGVDPLEYTELYKLVGDKIPEISNINSAYPYIRAKKVE